MVLLGVFFGVKCFFLKEILNGSRCTVGFWRVRLNRLVGLFECEGVCRVFGVGFCFVFECVDVCFCVFVCLRLCGFKCLF